jgi:hypothetical protein
MPVVFWGLTDHSADLTDTNVSVMPVECRDLPDLSAKLTDMHIPVMPVVCRGLTEAKMVGSTSPVLVHC